MTRPSGTWTPTQVMNFHHAYHTATLLKDGTVLVAGSGPNAELYVPSPAPAQP